MSDELRLEAVDPAEAGPHRDAWAALAEEAEDPNVFLSPFYLEPAVRAFGGGRTVKYVFVYAPHPTHKLKPPVLVGFVPLEHKRSRTRLPIPITTTFVHPHGHLGTPLCRPGYTRAVAEKLLDHLGGTRRVVMLQQIRGDGPFHEAIVDALNARSWLHVGLRRATRALLIPDSTADAYIEKALNGKRRKELRRQRDRLAEQGGLEVLTLGAREDPGPWFDDFLRLEAASWKGREGVAVASKPASTSFFDASMRDAHRLGRLHMMALRLAGRPIAMKCNLLAGGGAFALKIAFDEVYAKFSPGVQLELEAIRWAHGQDKIRWMDSCAHHTRFMINHLWTARRAVESLAFSTGHASTSLLVALLPAVGWMRERLSSEGRKELGPTAPDGGGGAA